MLRFRVRAAIAMLRVHAQEKAICLTSRDALTPDIGGCQAARGLPTHTSQATSSNHRAAFFCPAVKIATFNINNVNGDRVSTEVGARIPLHVSCETRWVGPRERRTCFVGGWR